MSAADPPSTPQRVNRPLPLAARRLLRTLLKPVFALKGFRVEGAGRLPRRRRALILVANHAAFIDSVLMILAVRPRFTVCGAQPKYFSSAKKRALMSLANILRVDDGESFLRDCRRLLDDGEILLVYPEMGRYPEGLGPFRTWAAELALAARVPVLPCYIYGTTGGQEGPPRLRVGEEISPEAFPPAGEASRAEGLTDRLRSEILALAPPGARAEGEAA